MSQIEITIEQRRLLDELEQLAGYSDAPAPAVTRVLFTQKDLDARSYLKDLLADAALTIREDAVGNLIARWPGEDAGLPAVATGSHTDAIPHSGRFDGTVGVLGGLEAIRSLQRAGFRPRRSIELIMFTAEEPTRYGVGCLGSRLMSGAMSAETAAQLLGSDGIPLDETRRAAGFDGDLETVHTERNEYAAFVELHIEQGPLLERDGIPIGIVTAIAAPSALRVTYEGDGGHAGAVLMPDRNDSLLAGAELALAVERVVKELGGPDTVGTTGILNVHPGASNSIPSHVMMEIDVRDIEAARRDRVLQEIRRQAEEIGGRREQHFELDQLTVDPPAACDARVVDAAEQACREAEISYTKLISRAYHDASFMAMIAPTAMLFIPCRDGISHRPDEHAEPADIAAGVKVLALTLARLAEHGE